MPPIKKFYKAFMFGTVGKIQHVPSHSFEHSNFRCFLVFNFIAKVDKNFAEVFCKKFSIGTTAPIIIFSLASRMI